MIPTFNRPEMTHRALESVFKQSKPVHEIIVVDDGSSDSTNSDFEDIKSIKYVRHTKNKGVSAARNTGIKIATGDWVAFLDSDDQWHFDKIKKQTEDILKNPNIKIFYTDEKWIKDSEVVIKKSHQIKQSGYIFNACMDQCFIGPSTAIIKKSLLLEEGLFNEEFPVCEDYDLWLRLCFENEVYLNNEELIIKNAGHGDQLSFKHFAMDYWRLNSLLNIVEIKPLSSEYKLKAEVLIKKKYSLLYKGARKHNNYELLDKLDKLMSM